MKRSFSSMIVGDTDSETNLNNGKNRCANQSSDTNFTIEEAWMAAIASVSDLEIGQGYAKDMKMVIQNDELVFELVTCFAATSSIIQDVGNIDPRSPLFQDLLREVIFSFLETHTEKLQEMRIAVQREFRDFDKITDLPDAIEIECDLFSAIFDDWQEDTRFN